MSSFATLVRQATDEGRDGDIEVEIFGTTDPDDVAGRLAQFVADQFGKAPEGIFYRHSVGVVVGFRADGRELVLKVHRWRVDSSKLAAMQRVQTALADAGLPVPRPVMGPSAIGTGIATVEELLAGEVADGHDSKIRQAIATELFMFISAGTTITGVDALGSQAIFTDQDAPLWPIPHKPHYDFEATTEGAEWIDELARLARRRLATPIGPNVIGHFDWRVENLGFEGTRMVAIYDWDSLAISTEPFTVGCAAGGFSSDWSKAGGSLPSLEEMQLFVEDYERARGMSFSRDERLVLDAANILQLAYGARCQWSDHVLFPNLSKNPSGSWIGALRERGEHGLLKRR